jgi:hypothetical protein
MVACILNGGLKADSPALAGVDGTSRVSRQFIYLPGTRPKPEEDIRPGGAVHYDDDGNLRYNYAGNIEAMDWKRNGKTGLTLFSAHFFYCIIGKQQCLK